MALIDLQYKGLTGTLSTLEDVDDTDTLDELITAIASDEGLDSNYYQISKADDPTNTFSGTYGDSSTTLADLGISNGNRIICTTNQHGTKQQRQVIKLDIAAAKRSATYDITQLPTQYDGNDIIDNPNTDGLLEGRPWVEVALTPVMSLDAAGYSGSGNWLDSTTNNNDATLSGTPAYSSTAPKFFDLVPAEGDYFVVADSTTLDSMTEISFEMWINIDSIAANPNMLFSKRSTTFNGYVGFFTTTGWTFRFGTGTGTGLTYGTAPATGVWQHVVATIGSSGSAVYINGVEVATSAYTGNSANINTSAALDLFEVNPRPQTGPVKLNGKVAVFNIYDSVLDSTAVAANYAANSTRFGL